MLKDMFGVFVFEGNGGELQACVYKKYRTWNLEHRTVY